MRSGLIDVIVIFTWYIYALAKDCGLLDVPSNGSMFGNQTTYPHKVLFRCHEGFTLRGSQVRRCTSEGTWSGVPASCEGTRALSHLHRSTDFTNLNRKLLKKTGIRKIGDQIAVLYRVKQFQEHDCWFEWLVVR